MHVCILYSLVPETEEHVTTWGGRGIVAKFLELCKDIPLAKKPHECYMLENDSSQFWYGNLGGGGGGGGAKSINFEIWEGGGGWNIIIIVIACCFCN